MLGLRFMKVLANTLSYNFIEQEDKMGSNPKRHMQIGSADNQTHYIHLPVLQRRKEHNLNITSCISM